MSRLRPVAPLLLALATLGAAVVVPLTPAAAAAGGADVSRVAAPDTARRKDAEPGDRVKQVTVAWKGSAKKRVYKKSAVVPGIGRLVIGCRPDATFVRLFAEDRTAETQFWMAKHETKDDHDVVATKTARIYRYSDAADNGTGGTGRSADEGLNRLDNIENFSSGHLDGIISQRVGRHQAVTGTSPPPATSISLNWYWTGFRNPMSWRYCKIDAVLTTKLSPAMGVSWHGDADGATNQYAEYALPSIGTLQLRCEPDAGGFEGRRTVALDPVVHDDSSHIWAETVTGEGRTEDHVDGDNYEYDPVLGRISSIDLPRNGLIRLFVEVGGKKRTLILSSYLVTNNALNPALNVCETAVAAY
jgi:hypothetical protein